MNVVQVSPPLVGEYVKDAVGGWLQVVPRFLARLKGEVLFPESVAVAVTLGPFGVPDQEKFPEPSARTQPSYTSPSSALSEKISTRQFAQAVPATGPLQLAEVITGAPNELLPPLISWIPAPVWS